MHQQAVWKAYTALLTSNAISVFSSRIHFEYRKIVSKYSGPSLWRYVIDGPNLSFMSISFSPSLQHVLVGLNAENRVYSPAKELQSFGMHLPDIIQINKLREFLTENTLNSSCPGRERKTTHPARSQRLLDLCYFAPIIPPT